MRKALAASAALALVLTLALAATARGNPTGDSKMLTATGNVRKLQAADRTLVVALADGPETRFVWSPETRINGTLAVGARVTVRYTSLPDGQNLAHQISVGH